LIWWGFLISVSVLCGSLGVYRHSFLSALVGGFFIIKSVRLLENLGQTDLVSSLLVLDGYFVFGLFNRGWIEPGFAMRGIGFYQAWPSVVLLMFNSKDSHLLDILFPFAAGTIEGFNTEFVGLDAAVSLALGRKSPDGYPSGVLPFFFFSMRSFGASKAMMADAMGDLEMGPSSRKRIWYLLFFELLFFLLVLRFQYRGALAVTFGGLAYLITTRNFKFFIGGVSACY